MKIKKTAMQDMTYVKFRKLIALGQRAIELRLLGIPIRARAKTDADRNEMERIKALLAQYDELMDDKYWYRPPEAANDKYGPQER